MKIKSSHWTAIELIRVELRSSRYLFYAQMRTIALIIVILTPPNSQQLRKLAKSEKKENYVLGNFSKFNTSDMNLISGPEK